MCRSPLPATEELGGALPGIVVPADIVLVVLHMRTAMGVISRYSSQA